MKYGILLGARTTIVVEIPQGVVVNKNDFNPTSNIIYNFKSKGCNVIYYEDITNATKDEMYRKQNEIQSQLKIIATLTSSGNTFIAVGDLSL